MRAGCSTWFDEDQILAGHAVVSEIVRGINEADLFILIWSKAASRSAWVSDEILRALHRRVSSSNRFLIVVLRRDATPLPSGLSEYRWLRVWHSGQYAKALVDLLSSIADTFNGYIVSVDVPNVRQPTTTLHWNRSRAPRHENKTPYDETLSSWDLQSGKLVSSRDMGGTTESVTLVGGRFCIAATLPSEAVVDWDPDKHDLTLLRLPDLAKVRGVRLYGGDKYPWCVRTSPGKKFVAVAGGFHSGRVVICDAQLNPISRLELSVGLSLAWLAPDRLVVAARANDREVNGNPVVLAVPSGQFLSRLPGPAFNVVTLTTDTAGRYVVYSGGHVDGGGGVVVVDVPADVMRQYFKPGEYVSASCIAPNGALVAWADKDPWRISIVSCPDGRHVVTFDAHVADISVLRFDSTSRLLASGCMGGMVQVWDITNPVRPERLAKFKVAQGVQDVVFTENGRHVLVGNMHPDEHILLGK